MGRLYADYRPASEADIYAAFEAGARLENFFLKTQANHSDMTLKDWDDAANDFYDVNFAYLFKWLSDTYQIKPSEALWRELISDPAKTTVRDVCRFTAKHGALMLDPNSRCASPAAVRSRCFFSLCDPL
ncbi:MAG: hypothetical protein R3C45_15960 [Phycisphaerales bacterium]